MAAGAAFLAGSGVARLELVQLVAVAALYRRGIHAAAPPSCRAEKTAVAGAAKHPAAYPLLQTVTLCLFGAYQLGKAGAAHTESAPYLFATVQLLVLGTLCLLGWCYVCLGLWCVPFACFARPELPAWKVPLAAMRAMHGGRKELLALLGWYGLQMLPVVTIPWVLPQAVLSVTVFCNLRVQMTAERTADGAYRSLPRYAPSDN
ncbi:MAG: hypothetical protein ACLR5S_06945 [Ruminococcus sp.]